jgi:hypothetical protein
MRSKLPSLSGEEDESDEERHTDKPADSDIPPSLLFVGALETGASLSDERPDRNGRSESTRAGEQILDSEKRDGQHLIDAAHLFRARGARNENSLGLDDQVSW